MKNLTIIFITAMVIIVSLFILPHIQTGVIILLTINVFALFLYAMIKFKQHDILNKKYELELQRRLELEQELLKEIDLSNTIIRHKSDFIGLMGEGLPKG
jgi:hypothetical protein